jgi:hypothetical protein
VDVVFAARCVAGGMDGKVSSKVSQRAPEVIEIFLPSGQGDALGFCIAGALESLEHLSVATRNEAVKAARSEAGKALSKVSQRAAEVLEIFLPIGQGDGLGFCIAGALKSLEHLFVSARRTAVTQGRAAANKSVSETTKLAVAALGLFKENGQADWFGYMMISKHTYANTRALISNTIHPRTFKNQTPVCSRP